MKLSAFILASLSIVSIFASANGDRLVCQGHSALQVDVVSQYSLVLTMNPTGRYFEMDGRFQNGNRFWFALIPRKSAIDEVKIQHNGDVQIRSNSEVEIVGQFDLSLEANEKPLGKVKIIWNSEDVIQPLEANLNCQKVK